MGIDPRLDAPASIEEREPAQSGATASGVRRAATADRASAHADQRTAESDQVAADADQRASDADQLGSARDQAASDKDQAASDRAHAADKGADAAGDAAYEEARDERASVSAERFGNRLKRADTARDRDQTATERDRTAEERDLVSRDRDARASDHARTTSEPNTLLIRRLEELSHQAAIERKQAAADRARAAIDRANAARERARLEAELNQAHLDELTGAYRRQMGRLAISHEIDRARRGDGRFVLAFMDVDGLKVVNDRDGHAAGDRVLQIVVRAMRSRLRSFDPVMRYGGDEFVCGLGGADVGDARRRFESIGLAIARDAGVTISVGYAELIGDETADELIRRADEAMLAFRADGRGRSAATAHTVPDVPAAPAIRPGRRTRTVRAV